MISENEEQIQDAINAINGTETDCILSVLPSPFQERLLRQIKPSECTGLAGRRLCVTGHLDEIKFGDGPFFYYEEISDIM